MDLRLLTTFCAVAEAGSVSAASRTLLISQPALSRQVQALEHETGLQLFARTRGRLELTAAGSRFLEAAASVLEAASNAQQVAAALAAGRLERVRMAAPTTTLTDVLAPFLATLDDSDPLVTVTEAHYEEALTGLGSARDLAIVTAPPPRRFTARMVAALPVWAYVPRSHALAAGTSVRIEDLAQHPMVVLSPTFRPRALIDQALDTAQLSAPELIECDDPQVAQALAAAGRGVAIVSDDPRFDLVPLHIVAGPASTTLLLNLYAAWDPRHHAAQELSALADRLTSFCEHRYGRSPSEVSHDR